MKQSTNRPAAQDKAPKAKKPFVAPKLEKQEKLPKVTGFTF